MKATSLAVAVMAMACSVVAAGAAADNNSLPDARKIQQPAVQSSPEYQAAEDQFREYQQAYDRGDAKALASFYAEDVDYIDQDGAEVKGRGEMEKLFMENFRANPGAKITITVEELKSLTPDVQMNRGVATVTAANGTTESTRYAAVVVKKGDRWQICQLTQAAGPAPSAYSQLELLQWLIGNWENKDANQTIETKVAWAGDNNFLVRTFKLRGAEAGETDGWEIVGWDPDRQQVRSWIFDSNGGFGESSWAYDGGRWLIRASNVLPDGSRSTAENVLTKVDDNKFTWESQNRTLDGESQPSVPKIIVNRTTSNR
ncbi:MAG: SgcJ/EcaC family oxidoreductase [Verrucomicrobia bacterium]|nr:SgcJ/EcaC family oxidoreductase [Verrucomicrobiota bacterium]